MKIYVIVFIYTESTLDSDKNFDALAPEYYVEHKCLSHDFFHLRNLELVFKSGVNYFRWALYMRLLSFVK